MIAVESDAPVSYGGVSSVRLQARGRSGDMSKREKAG
jgi:hypothetical protein